MTIAPQAIRPYRPQVLYLVHRVPFPPNRGDRIRSFRILEYLANRADVHLAFLDFQETPAETLRTLNDRCRRVASVSVPHIKRLARGACSLLAGRTATEGCFRSPRLRRIISRWAADTSFDAVLVFCSSMFQYARLPALADVPIVVDLVDVDSQKWFDYAGAASGVRRWIYQLEGRRLRKLEAALGRRAQAVLLVSQAEAQLYRSFCPDAPIHVMPNGVSLEYYGAETAAADNSAQTCVFVGALDYYANVEGLQWFCTQVWPEIHRRRPETVLYIVGSNPTAAVRKLGAIAGVQLAADVPDVRPYISCAAVVVAPLRIARGIQNKVLQGLAMGKAVVATPQAIEGLAVHPGVHLLQAADTNQWVNAVLSVLDDPQLRVRLGQAGRAYVQEHHRWEDQLRTLDRLLGLDSSDEAHRADCIQTEHRLQIAQLSAQPAQAAKPRPTFEPPLAVLPKDRRNT